MATLNVLKNLAHNAVMGLEPARRLAMRFHSTGMNDDEDKLEDGWQLYTQHVGVAGQRILELGPGRSLQLLERALQHGAATCTALDIAVYDDARQVADRAGITLQAYDGRNFPLADDQFDAIWSADVLEHVRDPRALLVECRRVLAPGGRMVARIDLRDHFFLDDPTRWLTCLGYSPTTWYLMTSNRSTYVNRLRISDWEQLVDACGFDVLAAEERAVDDAILRGYRTDVALARFSDRDLAVYRVDLVLQAR